MELETAVVITAPHEVQALAVPFFKQYSPNLLTIYPAHITVIYPFVPPADLKQACATLRNVCASTAPFDVTLDGYDRFPRVTFMNPVNPEPILRLFRSILALFPACAPYGGEFGPDIHPHLTVSIFDSDTAQQQAVFPPYDPITFPVRQLHVLSGSPRLDMPWLTETVISLEG